MKLIHSPILALITALAAPVATFGQTVVVNLSGATLYDSTDTPLADGKLVQLVASTTDATFSAPTAGSFVSGDDVVIASFALDSSIVGVPGSFQEAVTIDTTNFTNLTAGDSLMLRWFDIDYVSGQTSPGNAHFGQFRTDSIVDGSDSGWFLPGTGSVSLNFVTSGNSGSQLESAGAAATAVPEPATYSLFLGLLAFAVISTRRIHLLR